MSADEELPLIAHLAELRSRLLRSLLCVLVIFLGLTFFANDLYGVMAKPLVNELSPAASMIATEVASPFITPIKLAFYLSVFIAMPYILYQLWAFVAPGLYENERRFAMPLLFTSIILFYAGIAFAYYIIFPIVFGFFIAVAPEGITVMTDISHYLDFIMKLFMAFGLAFEVPVITLLLTWSGIASVESLRKNRPYVIVGAFVIGMVLTPPDMLSQLLLAVPVWLLFELGLILSTMYKRKDSGVDNTTNDHAE